MGASFLPSSPPFAVAILFAISCLWFFSDVATAKHAGITRRYNFDIRLQTVTRLCHTKSMVTVNGKFPGPRIVAREGDRLLIRVVNHVQNNISIHWHGIRQLQSGWADGPSYVTQCPIQTGQAYVYNFTIVGQRGTFWWHAHISWLRASVYGPFVILPKQKASYPFPKPHKEVPILFGEWWNVDPEAVISQALQTGAGPNVSDAYTINGLPGPLYNCSSNETFKLKVKPGKTYLLRLINAALNDELFFSIANHTLTVVEADANYVKPFKTNIVLITPGQTTSVLLKTKNQSPNATFLMAARPYFTGLGTFDNSTTAGILEYEQPSNSSSSTVIKNLPLLKPTLPALNDTSFAMNFSTKFRSLANAQFPANVPQTVQKRFFFTVGLGTNPCPKNQTCQGPNNSTKFSASINNISFILPTTALLQAHFFKQSNGVYTTDFPTTPLSPFNYTGTAPNNTMVTNGTRVVVLPFNTSVELVMQDTSILGAESHPLHLHGYNFFVIGQGFGNYDPNKDPAKFNLVDPIERNTVGVPSGGWVAIRFLADNPVAIIIGMSCLCFFPEVAIAKHAGITRHYKFNIRLQNVTRLCHTKSMVTVNGKFPGPRIIAREGDRVLIKVVNHVQNNISIHWHGIRQLRSGWADGPAYVTQCPIQTGQIYVYNFTIVGQRGTLWWHAHISWLRATVYGPLVVLPRKNVSYPFPKPHKEVPILFGEWWNANSEAVITQALQTGAGPNVSDAYTINGLPGPLYNCSANDTFKLKVKPGKTYLLRLINAALNDELFFSIANHTLTVVEADAIYVKPFKTNIVLITPGQTTNILLKTKNHSPNATFLMAARPYFTGQGTFDNSTTAGILEYEQPSNSSSPTIIKNLPLFKPTLPALNDTSFAMNFSTKFRSLANAQFPANVPQTVQKHFFFTVGLGTNPCPKNQTCQGPNNSTKFAASVNNISFILPTTALLQAHFFGQSNGVYTTDFPTTPLFPFNYTGTPPNNTMQGRNIQGTRGGHGPPKILEKKLTLPIVLQHVNGTKVVVLPFNTSVELVMQDTSILGAESHPLHLHGFNVFVIGQGFGNYDPNKDPAKFNLVDPIERNTVGVPSGGWVAIRFLADNPGVWFMHCHYDVHLSWGLKMAWVVMDGKLPRQKLPPPPSDLPKC
ncbi:hypothetical protein L1049_007602 [Liquidambar formosana]|uniref:Laccase n=1 Tax=Liquidambar formosana TaxID=63359 RepID=A0AAP0X4S0_LIQFO